MPTFTSINNRKLNFNFVQPKTGEEIINEIKANQEKYGMKGAYKITDNEIENDLIKANDEKRKENAITSVKETRKDKDFQQAKVEEDFTSEVEKSLEGIMNRNGDVFEITSRIPNKLLVKQILPLTKAIEEKKAIVSETLNEKIDKAKQEKSFVEIKLCNKTYKIKFI